MASGIDYARLFQHSNEYTNGYTSRNEKADSMEATQDGTELMQRYDEARGWLAVLIDNPDKAVSVTAYKEQIKSAQKAVKIAHKAWMAAWV